VAISATLAGVRGVLCPLISAFLIQTLGVRSVYLTAASVMVLAIVLLSVAIRATARERSTARDRSLAPALS
jgi:fucose permease